MVVISPESGLAPVINRCLGGASYPEARLRGARLRERKRLD